MITKVTCKFCKRIIQIEAKVLESVTCACGTVHTVTKIESTFKSGISETIITVEANFWWKNNFPSIIFTFEGKEIYKGVLT